MPSPAAVRYPISLDVRLMLLVLRFLNRRRCYHCHSDEWATKRNRLGLRYCADLESCEVRMKARGLKSDVTGLREAMEETADA